MIDLPVEEKEPAVAVRSPLSEMSVRTLRVWAAVRVREFDRSVTGVKALTLMLFVAVILTLPVCNWRSSAAALIVRPPTSAVSLAPSGKPGREMPPTCTSTGSSSSVPVTPNGAVRSAVPA